MYFVLSSLLYCTSKAPLITYNNYLSDMNLLKVQFELLET